jgi:hypothetical protein
MANWTDLKTAIAAVIKTNGLEEITGQLLQNALNSIIDNVGENATFKGVATPTTAPGTPDGVLFYIASEAGVYANFDGYLHDGSRMAVLTYRNGWQINQVGVATSVLPTANIFNKDTIIDGFYLSGGIPVANPDFFISGYMEVTPSTLYSNNNTNQVEWYDANKDYISSVNAVTSFTTSADAVFVRVSSQTTGVDPEALMVVAGASTLAEYIPFAYTPIRDIMFKDGAINQEQTSFLSKTINLFDKRTIVDEFYLSGGVLTPNAAFFTSAYMKVKPNKLHSNNNTNQVEFYNIAKGYITALNGVTSFTTPSNAAFIRVASQTSAVAPYEVMIVEGASLPESYKPYSYDHDRELNTEFKYAGLKWTSLGTSITEANGYQPNIVGATDLVHTIRGIGSSTFAQIAEIAWVDGSGLLLSRPPAAPPAGTEGVDYFEIFTSMSNDERIGTIPLDTELLTVEGGTNDYANDIPLGVAGVLTNTTFKGSVSMAIEKILALMPTVRILMITPPGYSTFAINGAGLKMGDYAEAMVEVAKYYGMPYISIFGNCGWNPINHTYFLSDGTHPFKPGYLVISNLILGKLFEIKPIYKSEL